MAKIVVQLQPSLLWITQQFQRWTRLIIKLIDCFVFFTWVMEMFFYSLIKVGIFMQPLSLSRNNTWLITFKISLMLVIPLKSALDLNACCEDFFFSFITFFSLPSDFSRVFLTSNELVRNFWNFQPLRSKNHSFNQWFLLFWLFQIVPPSLRHVSPYFCQSTLSILLIISYS